jgi:large subunit ribosomal protein L15
MLHTLRPSSGSRPSKKRIARGNSGAGGTTAGRGTKGQHSRTGKGRRAGFEGGQVPLLRRQPKLGGFKRTNRIEYQVLNIGTLEEVLDAGTYSLTDLRDRRLVRGSGRVKILGEGTLSKKLEIEAHAASKSAKEAITKAGGAIRIVKMHS